MARAGGASASRRHAVYSPGILRHRHRL